MVLWCDGVMVMVMAMMMMVMVMVMMNVMAMAMVMAMVMAMIMAITEQLNGCGNVDDENPGRETSSKTSSEGRFSR